MDIGTAIVVAVGIFVGVPIVAVVCIWAYALNNVKKITKKFEDL